MSSYALDYPIAAQASESARASFIRRTYGHLAGAILAFAGLEYVLLQIDGIEQFVRAQSAAPFVMIALLIGGGWLARYWARSDSSAVMQYLGLSLYVGIFAVCMLPLMYYVTAVMPRSDGLIPTAGTTPWRSSPA